MTQSAPKNALKRRPTTPAIPCSANISKASSTPTRYFNPVEKLHTTPVTIPKISEPYNVIFPEEGVAATKPEIKPEHKPTVDHFFSNL
ncbi:hypothetical protein WICMUC_002687 [Wickerhamomyces mucosus]|uniref:Uncharacterized protein n=1 Tax=Wickerhamomyces mucosus TaxID=1378264 RepID=A0A9P8TE26_9ASCO|nr:hypothetical protein WICMUC_002687 [Wickerhamomyces mucosus]